MERFIGLLVFFIIFAIGKWLESTQKQKALERSKAQSQPARPADPVPHSESYHQPYSDSEWIQPDPVREEEYKASQDDVEDFLRSVGLGSSPNQRKSEVPVEAQILVPQPPSKPDNKKSPKPVKRRKISLSTYRNVHTNGHVRKKGMSISDLACFLEDKNQIRKAFVLSEILGTPVSFRRKSRQR